jgi:hypothetical protein
MTDNDLNITLHWSPAYQHPIMTQKLVKVALEATRVSCDPGLPFRHARVDHGSLFLVTKMRQLG